jgi:hypothetical protein
MTTFLFLLLLAAVAAWLLRPPTHRQSENPIEDPDELAEAEEEVQDLDTFATPEEAQEDLPDWGPGAPRDDHG